MLAEKSAILRTSESKCARGTGSFGSSFLMRDSSARYWSASALSFLALKE